jgi:thymidylate synthase (FAD)
MIELLDHLGDDLMVVNAARVSFAKWHSEFEENDARLISYLARHGHWSPFAAPQVQLRVTVPIFVARQWYRHTVGTTRNEVSRRYVTDEPEFYRIETWRSVPDASIKQGSAGPLPAATNETAKSLARDAERFCATTYVELLKLGVAPEQARSVLPQTMLTSWIETGSLAYWARFCNLRLDSHAQYEIRVEAQAISQNMEPLFPVSWKALVP